MPPDEEEADVKRQLDEGLPVRIKPKVSLFDFFLLSSERDDTAACDRRSGGGHGCVEERLSARWTSAQAGAQLNGPCIAYRPPDQVDVQHSPLRITDAPINLWFRNQTFLPLALSFEELTVPPRTRGSTTATTRRLSSSMVSRMRVMGRDLSPERVSGT